MAGHLMILNPKRARRRSAKRRSGGRRTMTAKQLRYFGPRRSRKAKRAKRRETVLVATSNPRRRKHHGKRLRRRFAKNPRPMRRRFRRNPVPFNLEGFLNGALVPAAIGAVGAIGVDFIIGNVPFPATMKTGPILPAIKIASALLIGWIVGEAGGASYGEMAAAGGMTVTVYGLAKNFMTANVPSIPLARYMPLGRYLGRRRRLGFIRRAGMRGALRQPRMRIVRPTTRFKLAGVRPVGVPRLRGAPAFAQSGRFTRMTRGLGYIGPARTLGRYAGSR